MLEKLEDKFEKLKLFDEDFGLSTTEVLRNLSSQLGVDYGGGEIQVTKGDREYLMFIYLPVRGGGQENLVGTPSFFEIKTNIPYAHPFFGIRKSTSLDWISEHVFAMSDYQVGDADFDTKFHIKVKDKDWGSRFFSYNCIRLGISSLLLQGFDLIRSEEGGLKIIKYLPLGGPYPTVEMINNAIEQVDIIISNIPNDYVYTACVSRNKTGTVNDPIDHKCNDIKEDDGEQINDKNKDHDAVIFNEVSRDSGVLFLIVILCPIILIVLQANNIQIPNLRYVFWTVAVLGILIFLGMVVVHIFFLSVLSGVALEKYLYLQKRYFKTFTASNNYLETVHKNGRGGAVVAFVFFLLCYIGFVRFLYFITFNK